MTISEIITKHYEKLHAGLKANMAISLSKTEEDIFQDVCVTALRKYKDTDIEEEEGYDYLKRSLLAERHFQYHRKKNDLLVFVEHPEGFSTQIVLPEEDFPLS